MDVDSCRRIREHFCATFHFHQACRMAYIEVLVPGGAATGVGWPELNEAVGMVHELLSISLPGYSWRLPFPPSPSRVYLAFLTLLVTQDTSLSDSEFEEFALDVIVEEAWSYMKWDLGNRIVPIAMRIRVADAEAAAAGDWGERAYLASVYAAYCACIAAITLYAVRFRDRFFRL